MSMHEMVAFTLGSDTYSIPFWTTVASALFYGGQWGVARVAEHRKGRKAELKTTRRGIVTVFLAGGAACCLLVFGLSLSLLLTGAKHDHPKRVGLAIASVRLLFLPQRRRNNHEYRATPSSSPARQSCANDTPPPTYMPSLRSLPSRSSTATSSPLQPTRGRH